MLNPGLKDTVAASALPTGAATLAAQGQVRDTTGALQNIKVTNNYSFDVSLPYVQSVAKGFIPSARDFFKLGYNAAIAATLEDVWELGGTIPIPATAITMRVVSTSANDAAAGTGARTVSIDGLDTNYNEIFETVTLNGLTPVNTVNQYLRINDFHVITAGTGGVAAGNVNLQDTTGVTTYRRITAGGNRDLTAMMTVPAGKNAYLLAWSFGSSLANAVRFMLRATCDMDGNLQPGIFLFQDIGIQNSGTTWESVMGRHFPAKTDVKISGNTLAGGTTIASGSFEIYYE